MAARACSFCEAAPAVPCAKNDCTNDACDKHGDEYEEGTLCRDCIQRCCYDGCDSVETVECEGDSKGSCDDRACADHRFTCCSGVVSCLCCEGECIVCGDRLCLGAEAALTCDCCGWHFCYCAGHQCGSGENAMCNNCRKQRRVRSEMEEYQSMNRQD